MSDTENGTRKVTKNLRCLERLSFMQAELQQQPVCLEVDIEKKLDDKVLKVCFTTRKKNGIMGILGASGCGKSMTLKCIAGIETPDRGRIVLNGRTLFDSEKKINVKVQERRVGYLFQNYALFPNMTVQENIEAAVLYQPGVKRDKAKKEEAADKARYYMELFRVTDVKDSYPGRMSGGQQQRAALARIFASDPEILMLDEPFSALDAFLKEKLQLELLQILRTYENSILMVTHSRDEIYRFCRHMLVVENGSQVGCGLTEEVFRNPGTTAAAKLTGCKNIEPVERLNGHKMYVPGWDATIEVRGEIPEDTTHIGIRAHYLRETDKSGKNTVVCRNGQVLDDPFELVVVFERNIWWKISKEEWKQRRERELPKILEIPEESLLYLREK